MKKGGYISRTDGNVVKIKPLAKEIQVIFDRFGMTDYNVDPIFELEILEELLRSDIVKDSLRLRVTDDLIRQDDKIFVSELIKLLVETSKDIQKYVSEMKRTKDPFFIYGKMSEGKFKTKMRYRKNLKPSKYFVKWMKIIESVDLENKLELDFPDIEVLWNDCIQKYRYLQENTKKKDWIPRYKSNWRLILLMWLLPDVIIYKFTRIEEFLSEVNWSKLMMK